jgi:hypothetical protein
LALLVVEDELVFFISASAPRKLWFKTLMPGMESSVDDVYSVSCGLLQVCRSRPCHLAGGLGVFHRLLLYNLLVPPSVNPCAPSPACAPLPTGRPTCFGLAEHLLHPQTVFVQHVGFVHLLPFGAVYPSGTVTCQPHRCSVTLSIMRAPA